MKLEYILKLIIFFSIQTAVIFIYKWIFKEKKLTFTEKIINLYIPSTKRVIGTITLVLTILRKITKFYDFFLSLLNIVSIAAVIVGIMEAAIQLIIHTDLLKLLNFNNPNILLNNKIKDK